MGDFDAYAWGSLDVSRKQLLSQLHDLTPEGWKRVGAVIGERVRSSQAREPGYERGLEELEPAVERLERLTKLVEELMDRLDSLPLTNSLVLTLLGRRPTYQR